MADLQLLHNPRCSKSRAAHAILLDSGHPFEVVEYLQNPLSEAALRDLLGKLGTDDPLTITRTKEAAFAEQGLQGATADKLLRALAHTPALMERPIVIRGDRAVVARPPERLLALLEE